MEAARMRPAPRRLWLALLVLTLPLILPASVGAFPLTTCTLTLTSTDANGKTIATATGGADDATETHPFLGVRDGTRAWRGTPGGTAVNYNPWRVAVFLGPTPPPGAGLE